MSATNTTPNYSLPVFQATDKPAWLTDWNGAMNDIDTAIKEAKTAGDNAQTTANTATSDISTINSSLSTINTSLTTLTSNVNSNTGSINTINSLIGNGTPTTTDQTIIGAINELHADITGGGDPIEAENVEYDNTTSGLSATDVQSAIDEIVSSTPSVGYDLDLKNHETVTITGGTNVTADSNSAVYCIHNDAFNIGKVYGYVRGTMTGAMSGAFMTLTIPNLNTTTAYDIAGFTAFGTVRGTAGSTINAVLHFNVGNTVDIAVGATLQSGDVVTVSLPPCLLFFEDLGD